MSFATGFRYDGGGSSSKSGSLEAGGKDGNKYWGNLGILEGTSLVGNSLWNGAVEFGTSATPVKPCESFLVVQRLGVILRRRELIL